MPSLKKYSMVAQVAGARPYTTTAYSGTDLSQVLGITQGKMAEGWYGWVQTTGDGCIMTSDGTQEAYADFRPNNARMELDIKNSRKPETHQPTLPEGALDAEGLAHQRSARLSDLPPLLIEVGPYCSLLREARDVFVDGHFYACVAMCGISLERFQRDKAEPYGGLSGHKMPAIRGLLKGVLESSSLRLCKKMANMRNDYAHGHGLSPKKDALGALKWLHEFVRNETDLLQDYVIKDGILHREAGIKDCAK